MLVAQVELVALALVELAAQVAQVAVSPALASKKLEASVLDPSLSPRHPAPVLHRC